MVRKVSSCGVGIGSVVFVLVFGLLVWVVVGSGCGSWDRDGGRADQASTRASSAAGISGSSSGMVRVLIGFRAVPGPSQEAFVQRHGGQVRVRYHLVPAIAATLPQRAVSMLEDDPNVAYIELDGQGQLLADEVPWGVQQIGATVVHERGPKGAGIKVAVIDTGIDYRHNDLKANYAGGIDIANNDPDPMDWHGHGTHCAGIIAADDDGTGIVGVAPDAQLYALKVFADGSTSCWWSDVILALQWCVDHQIHIASMSIGGDVDSTLEQACNAAYQKGVLLVAAAGNSGGAVMAPACYDSVIAVGATDSNNVRASWSCYGPSLELMAPGLSIKSTLLNNTYGTKSGTSMACPHVTGSAALVWSASPTWSATQVRQQLDSTAQDLGTAGKDDYYGYGLVRADLAVGTIPPPPPPPPPPTLSKVEVVPTSASIEKGQTQQFTATAVYSDGSKQDVTGQAAWSSSDPAVATVAAGLATGVGAGSATIQAAYEGSVGQASLTVTEPVSSRIQIWRVEYLTDLGQLRVFVNYPVPKAVLHVYSADESRNYGKMAWAGGEYYVLSRIKVPDPNGWIKVVAAKTGEWSVAEVTYR